MALLSQSDIEARLGRTLSADEATALVTLSAALQAQVEELLGSKVEEVSPSTRYYDGGVQHLAIDPCTNVTAVNIVDDDQVVTDTVDTTDYLVDPLHRTLKTQIRYRAGAWLRGMANIAVTAKFSIYGDENMRNIVKNGLLDMVAQAVDNKENITSESIEGYSVQYGFQQTEAIKALKSLYKII